MHISLLRCIFPGLAVYIAGCSHGNQADHVMKPAHVCQYKKVEGRFRFHEGSGYTIETKGRKNWVRIISPGQEFATYRALEPKIVSDTRDYPAKKNNKIYVVGKLSECVHPIVPPNAENKDSAYYGLRKEEYTLQGRNFVFEKWYIKKPFLVAVESSEDGLEAKFIKRTSLKMSDFNPGILERGRIHLTPEYLRRHVQ